MKYEIALKGKKKILKKGDEPLKRILKIIDDEILLMRK